MSLILQILFILAMLTWFVITISLIKKTVRNICNRIREIRELKNAIKEEEAAWTEEMVDKLIEIRKTRQRIIEESK